MCGIAGIAGYRKEGVLSEQIRKMKDAISHRGPDADGTYADIGIALGHTRLSILDLREEANQPFYSTDGRYIMVYNGEVYNYRELRQQLPTYEFKTDSDTEVVLASFIQWGAVCLEKFNGMFALAIWDTIEQELFICRDRLGIKPLYYFETEEGIAFSSEIRALLSSGMIPRVLDRESVRGYLMYQTVLGSKTLIKGAKQFAAGSYAVYKKNKLVTSKYWSPQTESNVITDDIVDIRHNIKELLLGAVEQRMISDVPLGAFLSGGIDSSAIVGLMASISDQRVNTFSVTFDDPKYDESQYSNLISNKFNTVHHKILLKPTSLLEHLDEALSAMDSPSGDGVNSYIISKETRKNGLTVALSGLGGDELFAGYPVFKYCHKLMGNHPIWKIPLSMRQLVARVIEMANMGVKSSRISEILRSTSSNLADVYPVIRQIFTNQELKALFRDIDVYENPHDHILRGIKDDFPVLSKVSLAEILTYTQNVLLKDVDQMSMAHALEVRVPFFDHRLVEYAINIPDKHKYPDYPKKLLVESLSDILPAEIVHREKKGFAFPWEEWMRGELGQFCQDQLQSIKQTGIFNNDSIDQLWSDFKSGKKPVIWTKIWLLVVLGYWINKNLD